MIEDTYTHFVKNSSKFQTFGKDNDVAQNAAKKTSSNHWTTHKWCVLWHLAPNDVVSYLCQLNSEVVIQRLLLLLVIELRYVPVVVLLVYDH
jgi:hypothetical protein